MKSIFFYWLGILFLFAVSPHFPAEAHTFQSAGGMGFLMHISPNDEPVAEETALIHLEIQGTPEQEASYDWSLTILKKEIIQDTLTFHIVPGHPSFSSKYVFRELGSYILQLRGTPLAEHLAPVQVFFTSYVSAGNSFFSEDGSETHPLQVFFPYVVLITFSFILLLFLMPLRRSGT